MKKYLLKFLIRPLGVVLGSIVLLSIIVTITGNLLLAATRGRIAEALGGYTGGMVSVGGAWYLPPDFIILNGIKLAAQEPEKDFFSLRTARISFSLPKLLGQRSFFATGICLNQPQTEYEPFVVFCSRHPRLFKDLIDYLLQTSDFSIRLNQARLRFSAEPELSTDLTLNLSSRIKSREIIAFGWLGIQKFGFDYDLRAILSPADLSIENLNLNAGHFSARL